MATRAELIEAIGERYRSADRGSKGRVLDEFVAVTGFHRKHAMRLMRTGGPVTPSGVRLERRIYDEAARTALVVLWEAADRVCGKRLRPLIPILLEAMQRHGHLDVAPGMKTQLTKMSAATIDRALRAVKAGGRAPRRRGVAGSPLRQSVPIRTFDDWGDPAPGHIGADLVSHSGPVAKGSFAWTFTLTDIATGWTECAPLLVREQTRVDRLARSMKDLQDIVHELKGRGVALKATEQPIDTSTAAGKAFLDMLGVFAEFETNLRRERQAEGIQAAKARGVYKGGKARADPEVVRKLAADGMKTADIARQLGISRGPCTNFYPRRWDWTLLMARGVQRRP